jgi:xanthosine utilization system XapX-like protein
MITKIRQAVVPTLAIISMMGIVVGVMILNTMQYIA